jgi:TolA-binding protein
MLASMVGIILAAVWQRIYEGWRESRAQARRAEDQARIIRECQEEIKRIRAREIQMQEQIRRAKEGEKR